MELPADTRPLAEALDQVQEAVEMKSTIPGLAYSRVALSDVIRPSGRRPPGGPP